MLIIGNMNIIEGNKLIAKFMGFKYIPFDSSLPKGHSGWWKDGKVGIINKSEINFLGRNHNDLTYHSNLNMLIPVVEKIAKCEYVDYFSIVPTLGSDIYFKGLEITLIPNCWTPCKEFYSSNYKSILDCIYESVIKFIKWYNETFQIQQ